MEEEVSVYDSRNNLISFTDKNGNKTRYRYDSNGNLTRVINPLDQLIKVKSFIRKILKVSWELLAAEN